MHSGSGHKGVHNPKYFGTQNILAPQNISAPQHVLDVVVLLLKHVINIFYKVVLATRPLLHPLADSSVFVCVSVCVCFVTKILNAKTICACVCVCVCVILTH